MTQTTERIQINELDIPVRRSARRKSVGITVDRDGAVYVAAPLKCDFSKIEEFVRSKSLWIYQKLVQREALGTKVPAKQQFVDGACFWFLGDSFRLRIVSQMPEGKESVPLVNAGDRFLLHRDSIVNAKELFRRWYVEQGSPIVRRVVALYRERIAKPESVELRDVGFRWGSCTQEGKVLISWRAIQLPMDALEYVVVHEMTHLLHHHHDQSFWQQLQKVMPDYEERKDWLARNGDKFATEF